MVFFVNTPSANDAQELMKSEKDKSKSGARDITRNLASKIKDMSLYTCSSCGDTVAKLKQCPCGTVHYSSEKCQHDDWPRHKRECPHRKNREWGRQRQVMKGSRNINYIMKYQVDIKAPWTITQPCILHHKEQPFPSPLALLLLALENRQSKTIEFSDLIYIIG